MVVVRRGSKPRRVSAPLPIATDDDRDRLAVRIERHRLGLGYALTPSRGHAAAARDALAFLCAERGRSDLHDVTPADVRAYYRAEATRLGRRTGRDEGPLTRESLRRQFRRTAALFDLLHADGALARDPASGIPPDDYLPAPTRAERLVPTERDVARLYDAAEALPPASRPARARALLALAYGCGLRAAELAACALADVRLGERVVVVTSGKGGRRRVVPMGPGVVRDLERYLFGGERRDLLAAGAAGASLTATERAAARAAVLVNDHGRALKGYSANPILRRLAAAAGVGIPVTCHVLRHAIATHLLERGATTEHLRRFLGHAHLDTTRLYVHVGTDHLAAVTPAIDDALAPPGLALDVTPADDE